MNSTETKTTTEKRYFSFQARIISLFFVSLVSIAIRERFWIILLPGAIAFASTFVGEGWPERKRILAIYVAGALVGISTLTFVPNTELQAGILLVVLLALSALLYPGSVTPRID